MSGQPYPPIVGRVAPHGVDWAAVLLELIPLTSVLLAVWFFAAVDTDAPFIVVLLPLLASGAGWWRIGRFGTGCLFAIVRTIVLWALASAAVVFLVMVFGCAWDGADDPDCDATAAGMAFLASLGLFAIVALLVPIISAVMVARASRNQHRGR